MNKYFFWLLPSFFCFALGARQAVQDDAALKDYVQKKVSLELEKQLLSDPLLEKRPMHQKKDVYLLPNLPFYTTYFNKQDFIQFLVSFDTASQAYIGNGHSRDLSKLVISDQPILVQDVLLASKLASTGKLISIAPLNTVELTKNAHYLSILAGQELVFDASLNQLQFAAHYARHFRKGDVAVGFYVPFKVAWQSMHLANELDPDIKAKLKDLEKGYSPCGTPGTVISGLAQASELQFFKKYNDLKQFVDDIFVKKNITHDEKTTIGGLSDLVGYFNVEIQSHRFSRIVTGASVLVPTAQECDANNFWQTPLGNGGNFETALFVTAQWEEGRWFNPYVHSKATYAFPMRVNKRVPEIIEHDGIKNKGQSASKKMVFGETLILGPTSSGGTAVDFAFSEPDSTVRGFADTIYKLKINTGPQFLFRLGNVFTSSNKKLLADLSYEFWLKGRDYVSHRAMAVDYDASMWGHNSDSMKHTLGLAGSYQIDKNWRTHLGGSYVFAGRNTPKRLMFDFSLNIEF